MLTVLAIDPGRCTGYCQAKIEDGKVVLMPWQQDTTVNLLWNTLENRKPDIIIIEKFEFRKKSTEGLDLFPRELIGVARLWSINNHSDWYEQSPSYGLGYYNDKQLKLAKVHVAGLPHAMDATRHLLHWFTFGPGFKYNTTGDQFPFKLAA